jgi:hypothetical protein
MARVEFCCRSGGDNLNAGSLDGTNEPSASPLAVYTGGDWNSGTAIYTAPVGADLTEAVVGRFISIYHDGDTAPVSGQWQVSRITAVNSGTRQITVTGRFSFGTSAVVTGTGNRSARISGAWSGPSGSARFPFASGYGQFGYTGLSAASTSGIRINMRNDQTYSVTAGLFYHEANCNCETRGYSTVYGDAGRALIQGPSTGSAFTMMTLGINSQLKNLILDCNGGTGNAHGIIFDGNSREMSVKNVVVRNMRGWGIATISTATVSVEGCEVHNCNTSATSGQGGVFLGYGSRAQNVISHDNNGYGFSISSSVTSAIDCIADSNSSIGFYINMNFGNTLCQSCDSYGNGSHGFQVVNIGNGGIANIKNCNSVSNTGWGLTSDSSALLRIDVRGFATFGNTSGSVSHGFYADVFSDNIIAYASSPYAAPSSGDFRLSLAAAKQSGSSYFLQTASGYSGSVSYPDIGALQAADGGSSKPQHPMTQQVIG